MAFALQGEGGGIVALCRGIVGTGDRGVGGGVEVGASLTLQREGGCGVVASREVREGV